MKDRQYMLALFASVGGAAGQANDLFGWDMDDLNWMSRCLDPAKNYDTIKAFKSSRDSLKLMTDDLSAIRKWAADGLQKDLEDRMAKQLINREACCWDVEMVNDMVMSMDCLGVLIQDVLEVMGEPPEELQKQAISLASYPPALAAFKVGPFTDLLRAMDIENILWLTDKLIEIPDQPSGGTDTQALAIALAASPDLKPEEAGLIRKIFSIIFGQDKEQAEDPSKILVPVKSSLTVKELHPPEPKEFKVYDFRSKAFIEKIGEKMSDGTERRAFTSKMVLPEAGIDYQLGRATGIIMPVGSPARRYLDGDYFPDDVVHDSMVGWMLNSPQINRYHDEKDLFNFWEHPDFRLVETWQERTGFVLGGDLVCPGDWCGTIQAINPGSKAGLMDGEFNGFSVEGWVTHCPDEILVHG